MAAGEKFSSSWRRLDIAREVIAICMSESAASDLHSESRRDLFVIFCGFPNIR